MRRARYQTCARELGAWRGASCGAAVLPLPGPCRESALSFRPAPGRRWPQTRASSSARSRLLLKPGPCLTPLARCQLAFGSSGRFDEKGRSPTPQHTRARRRGVGLLPRFTGHRSTCGSHRQRSLRAAALIHLFSRDSVNLETRCALRAAREFQLGENYPPFPAS